jgi:hypothetical protein
MIEMVRRVTVALLVLIWILPGPRFAEAADPGRPEMPVAAAGADALRATSTKRVLGSAADVERLAAREREAGQLETFEGGSHIGTTTIIIILLLVIVLILVIR